MRFITLLLVLPLLSGVHGRVDSTVKQSAGSGGVSLVVLGTIQDAGSPQAGCKKDCCKKLFLQPDRRRMVVSLGLTDSTAQKKYLFEATPDFTRQIRHLKNHGFTSSSETPDGIFLTHAHIGHYTGLMYLGKEAMNSKAIPVYAMPRMKSFLDQNGPWSQLVSNNNISLQAMADGKEIILSDHLRVIPFKVPHRDEFSETVGYTIIGPGKKALFIPDIDKWQKWGTSIVDEIAKVDYALVDGTFFDAVEISNPNDPAARDISTIPHPLITESMELFKNLPAREKKKIFFIHFNHTNPVLQTGSNQYRQVINSGFNVAGFKMVLPL